MKQTVRSVGYAFQATALRLTLLTCWRWSKMLLKKAEEKEKERSKAKLTPRLLRSEGCATYSVVLCKAGSHGAMRCTIMLITRIC